MATSNELARQAFSELGGTLRTREALAAGICRVEKILRPYLEASA